MRTVKKIFAATAAILLLMVMLNSVVVGGEQGEYTGAPSGEEVLIGYLQSETTDSYAYLFYNDDNHQFRLKWLISIDGANLDNSPDWYGINIRIYRGRMDIDENTGEIYAYGDKIYEYATDENDNEPSGEMTFTQVIANWDNVYWEFHGIAAGEEYEDEGSIFMAILGGIAGAVVVAVLVVAEVISGGILSWAIGIAIGAVIGWVLSKWWADVFDWADFMVTGFNMPLDTVEILTVSYTGPTHGYDTFDSIEDLNYGGVYRKESYTIKVIAKRINKIGITFKTPEIGSIIITNEISFSGAPGTYSATWHNIHYEHEFTSSNFWEIKQHFKHDTYGIPYLELTLEIPINYEILDSTARANEIIGAPGTYDPLTQSQNFEAQVDVFGLVHHYSSKTAYHEKWVDIDFVFVPAEWDPNDFSYERFFELSFQPSGDIIEWLWEANNESTFIPGAILSQVWAEIQEIRGVTTSPWEIILEDMLDDLERAAWPGDGILEDTLNDLEAIKDGTLTWQWDGILEDILNELEAIKNGEIVFSESTILGQMLNELVGLRNGEVTWNESGLLSQLANEIENLDTATVQS